MSLKPAGDRVLILPDIEPEIRSMLIVPDTAKGEPTQGVIVAVGPGGINAYGAPMEMPFRPGQHVVYGKYSGQEIEVDGKKHKIMRSEEIWAEIVKEAVN